MKKIYVFIVLTILSINLHALQFIQGTDYQVLDTTASTEPKVTEYFSFYCPHCYNFEPAIQNVKQLLPTEVKLNKVHVSFMGGNMGASMAKAYAVMVVLGVENKMIPAMFEQIHVLRSTPRNESDLRQLFVDNGIDGNEYDAAFNSFVVESMQKQFDIDFQKTKLTGVPSVVVNNKYQVTPTNVKSIEDYMELINFLLQK